jgi:hypothetical protein
MREEPEEKREEGTKEQAGNDGKVKRSVFAAVDDVAGKFSKTKGEPATEVKNTADKRKQPSQEEERAAELAEGVHEGILPEPGRQITPDRTSINTL